MILSYSSYMSACTCKQLENKSLYRPRGEPATRFDVNYSLECRLPRSPPIPPVSLCGCGVAAPTPPPTPAQERRGGAGPSPPAPPASGGAERSHRGGFSARPRSLNAESGLPPGLGAVPGLGSERRRERRPKGRE